MNQYLCVISIYRPLRVDPSKQIEVCSRYQ